MKAQTNINGISQGIHNNQSIEEVDQIIEQIKFTKMMRKEGDRVAIGTDNYTIIITKIK